MGLLCLCILLLLLTFQVESSPISHLFETWCKEHGKAYTSNHEKLRRLKIFQENYDYVTRHNALTNSSYTLSINSFADLSYHEFKSKYLGLSLSASDSVIKLSSGSELGGHNLLQESVIPSSLDWRSEGAVSEVKDQGSCGACWSFSATGAIEGINKIVTGSLVSLSEQQLIDCDKSYNDGCRGGLMEYAYKFVIKNQGIDSEEDYPYKGRDGSCIKDKLKRHTVTIDSYVDIPSKNERLLLEAVATQPVSVGICSSDKAFQFYSKGIFSGPCSTSLDHAVLIVGYASKNGKDYWILKNSWGRYWGMDGYMHMLRNGGAKEGVCGINMLASYPTKTSPNPPPSPSPTPTRCNLFTYCSSGETCCCTWSFIGICFSWKCCEAEWAVCCKDHHQCCSRDYPICDTKRSLCLKRTSNSTMARQVAGKKRVLES